MINVWVAYPLDHSDERFGVGKNTINSAGKYTHVKYKRSFTTMKAAANKAFDLNLQRSTT